MLFRLRKILGLLGVGLVGTSACHAVLGDYAIEDEPTGPPLATTVCDAGQFRCNGAWIFECNDTQDGWFQRRVCPSAGACSSERRQCLTCAPDEYRCEGSALQTCSADQSGWDDVADCGSANACNLNSDSCRACVEGEYQCNGAQLTQCVGGVWQAMGDPCDTPQLCSVSDDGMEGQCLSPVCQAEGGHICSGNQLLRCQPGLASTVEVEKCDTPALCDATAADAQMDPSVSMIGACQGGCQGSDCFNSECGAVGRVECSGIELRKCTTSGWDTLAFCDKAALCNANDERCDEPACTAGQGRCVGGRHDVCRDDRTGWDSDATCTGSALCDPDEGCVPGPCAESKFRCNWTYLEQCMTGTWERVDRCASPAQCSVSGEACAAPACGGSLGEFKCIGQSLQRCNATRTAYEDVTTCEADQACNAETGSCD